MSMLLALALSTAVQPEVEAQAPNDPDRVICKARPKTGSRVGAKTCRTAAEWDRITEEHRRAAREMIDRPMIEGRRGN